MFDAAFFQSWSPCSTEDPERASLIERTIDPCWQMQGCISMVNVTISLPLSSCRIIAMFSSVPIPDMSYRTWSELGNLTPLEESPGGREHQARSGSRKVLIGLFETRIIFGEWCGIF